MKNILLVAILFIAATLKGQDFSHTIEAEDKNNWFFPLTEFDGGYFTSEVFKPRYGSFEFKFIKVHILDKELNVKKSINLTGKEIRDFSFNQIGGYGYMYLTYKPSNMLVGAKADLLDIIRISPDGKYKKISITVAKLYDGIKNTSYQNKVATPNGLVFLVAGYSKKLKKNVVRTAIIPNDASELTIKEYSLNDDLPKDAGYRLLRKLDGSLVFTGLYEDTKKKELDYSYYTINNDGELKFENKIKFNFGKYDAYKTVFFTEDALYVDFFYPNFFTSISNGNSTSSFPNSNAYISSYFDKNNKLHIVYFSKVNNEKKLYLCNVELDSKDNKIKSSQISLGEALTEAAYIVLKGDNIFGNQIITTDSNTLLISRISALAKRYQGIVEMNDEMKLKKNTINKLKIVNDYGRDNEKFAIENSLVDSVAYAKIYKKYKYDEVHWHYSGDRHNFDGKYLLFCVDRDGKYNLYKFGAKN